MTSRKRAVASTTGAMKNKSTRRKVKLIQRKLLMKKVVKFKNNLSTRRNSIIKEVTETRRVDLTKKENMRVDPIKIEIRSDLIKIEERIMSRRVRMRSRRELKVKKEKLRELLRVMIIRREIMREEEEIEEMIEEEEIEEKEMKKSSKKKK